MDDEAVGINNGESVIRLLTCMIMTRSYVPWFSRRCTSCYYVFEIEWQAAHQEYNGATQWSLGK